MFVPDTDSGPQFSDRPLKTATQQDLIDYVNGQAAKIQSLQATVDIDSSVGDPKNGRITDYKEIRGYVLARKPAMLRMKGLMPVVRNTAFDMVSDGQEFKIWIPPTNKFVVGANNAPPQPDKRLENMRPQYIYEALLMPEIGRTRLPYSTKATKLFWTRGSIRSNSRITNCWSSARGLRAGIYRARSSSAESTCSRTSKGFTTSMETSRPTRITRITKTTRGLHFRVRSRSNGRGRVTTLP
jgi:hypothetical protein